MARAKNLSGGMSPRVERRREGQFDGRRRKSEISEFSNGRADGPVSTSPMAADPRNYLNAVFSGPCDRCTALHYTRMRSPLN